MAYKHTKLHKILSKLNYIHLDGPLTIVLGSLLVIGVIMVASTTSVVGATSHGDGFYFVKRHLIFMGLGLCLFLFGASFNHQYYKKFILPTYFIAIIVLGLTLIPNIGIQLGGASRWINLGFFQFQPIELVKFFLSVFLATSLTIKQQDIKDFFKGLCPILAIVAIPILILSNQPDLGNIILILMVTFMMLFVGKCRISHLFTFIFLGLSTVITSILLHPYQMERIAIFLDPWKDPLGRS